MDTLSLAASAPAPNAMFGSPETLRRLEDVSADRGDLDLGRRVAELRAWLEDDLADVERDVRNCSISPTHRSISSTVL